MQSVRSIWVMDGNVPFISFLSRAASGFAHRVQSPTSTIASSILSSLPSHPLHLLLPSPNQHFYCNFLVKRWARKISNARNKQLKVQNKVDLRRLIYLPKTWRYSLMRKHIECLSSFFVSPLALRKRLMEWLFRL